MPLDPRTPVLVGAGQVNIEAGDAPEPVELLARAARRAAGDADCPELLAALDSIRVVNILSRRYPDPAALVAERVGASPRHRASTTDGGQTPALLASRTATEILEGKLDVALIGGAECWKTRAGYRARGEPVPWTTQAPDAAPTEVMGAPLNMSHQAESRIGLTMPVQVYPLFETALRAKNAWSVAEHRLRISDLWARFSAVAAYNPHAALRRPLSAETIATAGPSNRMIGFPYTKLLCSNNHVDQAAALILCSAERARSLGVPEDRWVFPLSAAAANDTAAVSCRFDLASSPAIRLAGRAAFRLAGVGAEELSFVDLYSCFPSAVQVAASELGLSIDDRLTLTGGLTFAGGPWNNYVTHSLAALAAALRQNPGAVGMCSANGGFLTKHAIGLYSTTPPAAGFRATNVQEQVDSFPTRKVVEGYEGPATVEASTVMHDRDGQPERAFVACLLGNGNRAWGTSSEPGLSDALMAGELAGSTALLGSGGVIQVP